MNDATTGTWARGISALTIFAEDLAAMRAFYGEVVGARLVMSDSESAAYAVGSMIGWIGFMSGLHVSGHGGLTMYPFRRERAPGITPLAGR